MGALSIKNAYRKHPLYTLRTREVNKKGPIPVLNEFLVLFRKHDLHTKKNKNHKGQHTSKEKRTCQGKICHQSEKD